MRTPPLTTSVFMVSRFAREANEGAFFFHPRARLAAGMPRCTRTVRLRRRALRSRDGRIGKRVRVHGQIIEDAHTGTMERPSPSLCASSGSVVAKAPSQFMDLLTPPWHAIPHESSSRPFSCRLLVRRVGGAGCPLRYPHVDTTFHG